METNPNQKTIYVQKEESNKNNLYAIYNLKALQNAMSKLDSNEFKLWCYMNKNQNGHTFALSKVDALKWGIGSASSYNRAVAALIQQGFLVETAPNHYDFYELPIEEENEEVLIITKKENPAASPNEEQGFRF